MTTNRYLLRFLGTNLQAVMPQNYYHENNQIHSLVIVKCTYIGGHNGRNSFGRQRVVDQGYSCLKMR